MCVCVCVFTTQVPSERHLWKYFLSEGKAVLCWFIITIIILNLKSSRSLLITSRV